MLQYADDTLIILRAEPAAARRLKEVLDLFSLATGLQINFHKSTVVPIHVLPQDLAAITDALGCRVEGFPQTYLGLPLSAEKLTLADFAPLIAKIDKYLSGWRAILLSSGGRVVLLNTVLDALMIYAMGAMLLPPALINIVEGLRRDFLWNVTERASGVKCLVAWDKVCMSKREGGLGVRCLVTQNRCLQVKLLHRLHSDCDAPWSRWIWDNAQGPVVPHRRYAVILLVDVGDQRSLCVVNDQPIGNPKRKV
jgi:hypothetical protein